MDIIVVSDNSNIKNIFTKIEKSRTYTLKILTLSDLKKAVHSVTDHTLFYIDISAYAEGELSRILNLLNKTDTIRFGIIDPKESFKDKALLFFMGASDYLGREQCAQGIVPSRLKNVLAFKPPAVLPAGRKQRRTDKTSPVSSRFPRAKNWNTIEPGNEYLFYMMFIELDGYNELHQRVGEKAIESLLSSFQRAVEKYLSYERGRLWIWNDFGGIILFPASPKIQAITAVCMRLMLSRRLISIEQCASKVLLSYRIVLCTGSTVYHERGKTGRIISDSVNSLSHIGSKFAQPGNFYITDELLCKNPSALQECFEAAGEFQNTKLFRMKLPVKY
jgi:class 3 adenylate cyclase